MQIPSSQTQPRSRPLEKTATPGIFKRGGRYVVVYRDPTGRQRKAAARTLAEARDLKAELRADIARGEHRAVSKVTFIEYAAEWIRSYGGRTARGIREATRDDYRTALGLDEEGNPTGNGAVAFFGRMQLAAIEPRDLKAYARAVADRGVSANTVRLALAPVKALLATAHDDGLIRANPAAGLRLALGRLEEHEDGHVKALTEEELGKLLAALPAEWRVFFEFLAQTGLRIGEAIGLRWQDIDLNRRRVHVRRRYYRGTFAPPKSKYGRRDVPLTKRLAQELELRWMLEEDIAGLVFPSSRGTVLDSANLMRRVLKPAARTAGVPWAGFHTLRHTCATALFRRGVNPKQAQVWLGHHSAAFTLDVYTHLLPDDLPDADVLDDLTAPEGGNKGATSLTETSRDAEPPGVAVSAA
jgi:integrase